eukprot:TRINITY_DN5383_c0_g1_i1.p1 TRINITY_DN5383_c0_g1~~TRINITY_DN5383_c0_g1_i1.p1  ORF type:complete len:444 (+),score=93.04 TRINITY_DN5383_c0_g1_i1:114-1445(+)
MASIVMLYGIILLILIMKERDNVVIRASSSFFNCLTIFGCLLSISSIYFFTFEPNQDDTLCLAAQYFFRFSFWLAFGPISLKTYRLSKAVNDPSLRGNVITDLRLFVYLLITITFSISYVSIWNWLEPIHRRTVTNQDGTEQWHTCDTSTAWSVILNLLEVAVQLGTGFLAWKVRKVKVQVKESIHIISVIGSSVMVFLTITLLLLIVPESPNTFFTSFVLKNVMIPFIVLTGLFVPKLYMLYRRKYLNLPPPGTITRVASSPYVEDIEDDWEDDFDHRNSGKEILYDSEGNELFSDPPPQKARFQTQKMTVFKTRPASSNSLPSMPSLSNSPTAATTTTTTASSFSASEENKEFRIMYSPTSGHLSAPPSRIQAEALRLQEEKEQDNELDKFSPSNPLLSQAKSNVSNSRSKSQPTREKERKKRDALYVSFAGDVDQFLQEY